MSDRAPPAGTSDDAFLGGALQILQPKDGYRAGLDAVLLAASVADGGEGDVRILDVGAGVGVVGLGIARRIPHARVTLVERDPGLAALARANITRNDLSERVHLIEADISRPLGELPELSPLGESFDCVLANPPFHTEGRGTSSRGPGKALAHAMAEGALDRWLRFLAALARPGGQAYVIHKADALSELLSACDGRFGDLVVLPIHPRVDAAATRIVVRGTKGSRAPLRIVPGLVLHGDSGHFRPDVEAILRHGAPLDLDRSA